MRRALALLLLIVVVVLFVASRETPLPRDVVADRIVVDKSDRTLSLLSGTRVLKTYHVAFGRRPQGRKDFEGDDRTPEGRYVIDRRNVNSKYHLALHVSYPNADDVRRARAAGRSAGGDIMIHGMRRGFGLTFERVGHGRDFNRSC